MNDKPFSWELFNSVPIVGIIRNLTLPEVVEIMPLYIESGLTTVEITMNTPDAAEMINFCTVNYGGKLNVGAGTVCKKTELSKALEAGAQFIVTPVIRKKIIRTCVKKEIPIFPGAFTPTEIYTAWSLGAPMVKVFPAKSAGPGYIKDVKAPLDQIKLMPTGGVDLETLDQFRKAGADGYGIGSPLFNKSLIAGRHWPELKEHFRRFVDKVSISTNN